MYYCGSDSYLERAQRCLEKEDPSYLFYAAYELRCFVESRQQEYLEAQKKYRKSLPARWKIGRQSAELRKIFRLEQVQKITNTFPDGFEFVSTYVPVSTTLRKSAERLGELLHSQNENLPNEKIEVLKNWLNGVYACAHECQSGNMCSPMLLDKSCGKTLGESVLVTTKENAEELKHYFQDNALFTAKVEYVDFVSEAPILPKL